MFVLNLFINYLFNFINFDFNKNTFNFFLQNNTKKIPFRDSYRINKHYNYGFCPYFFNINFYSFIVFFRLFNLSKFTKISFNSNNFSNSYILNSQKIYFDINNFNKVKKFRLFKKLDSIIPNFNNLIFYLTNFLKYSRNSLISNNFLFLRTSKIYNKGRYSRNRQYYRTGVY
jgi:hypothetical protein